MEFVSKTQIEKGWSPDRKYRAETADGRVFLLRVMPGTDPDRFRDAYEHQRRLAAMGVPMCGPVEYGPWEGGSYVVQRWIDGVDAETHLPTLSPAEQYAAGCEAGRILRLIHTVPAPPDTPDWEVRFNAKIDRKIRGYLACPLRIDGDGHIFRYIEENRKYLRGRPNVRQHGDYHVGNMMFERDADGMPSKLTVIDFNREDCGDPWEEFNRIVWCAQTSPAFARGRIDGYFGGPPPELFWRLLCLYIASNTLSSIFWAVPFGEREIGTMTAQAADVLRWFDDMKNPVPSWYREKEDNAG